MPAARPPAASVPGGAQSLLTCAGCGSQKKKAEFSKTQLQKKTKSPRCVECVQQAKRPANTSQPPKQPRRVTCSDCGQRLPSSRFSATQLRKRSPDLLRCKLCCAEGPRSLTPCWSCGLLLDRQQRFDKEECKQERPRCKSCVSGGIRGFGLVNAAARRSLRAVRLLLAGGADPNAANPNSLGFQWPSDDSSWCDEAQLTSSVTGFAPLHACAFGDPQGEGKAPPAEVARLLLESTASPNLRTHCFGFTPLMVAVHAAEEWLDINDACSLCRVLLTSDGCNPNLQIEQDLCDYPEGAGAMFMTDSPVLCRLLCKHGVRQDQQCRDGRTALMFHIESLDTDSEQDEEDEEERRLEELLGALAPTKRQVNQRDHSGRSALFFAAETHRFQPMLFTALRRAGADLEFVDQSGESILFYAVAADCPATVELCLEAGLDVNQSNTHEATAIAHVCSVEVAQQLLDAKADLARRGTDQSCALLSALLNGMSAPQTAQLCQLLTQHGASLDLSQLAPVRQMIGEVPRRAWPAQFRLAVELAAESSSPGAPAPLGSRLLSVLAETVEARQKEWAPEAGQEPGRDNGCPSCLAREANGGEDLDSEGSDDSDDDGASSYTSSLSSESASEVLHIVIDPEQLLECSMEAMTGIAPQLLVLRELEVELMHQPGADQGGIRSQWVGSVMAAMSAAEVVIPVWNEQPTPSSPGIPSGVVRLNPANNDLHKLSFLGHMMGFSLVTSIPLGLCFSSALIRQLIGQPLDAADMRQHEPELAEQFDRMGRIPKEQLQQELEVLELQWTPELVGSSLAAREQLPPGSAGEGTSVALSPGDVTEEPVHLVGEPVTVDTFGSYQTAVYYKHMTAGLEQQISAVRKGLDQVACPPLPAAHRGVL